MLKDSSGQVFTTYVLEVFDEKLSSDFNTIDKYAAHFGVSEKKLQRLLSYEGTSFSKVLDNHRENQAYKLLSVSRMPISVIANKLGYSSSASFNTACKRWFSKSPSQMRRESSPISEKQIL